MVDRGILKWNGSSFKFHFVVTGAPDCCCTYTHTHGKLHLRDESRSNN
jgi:hypothetical protein